MAVQNYYIALTYKLYVKDEEDETEAFAEQCDANCPFAFISHLACVLPAFEQKILGLEKGEAFDFTIPCAEGYGEFNEDMMFDVDKKSFEINGKFDSERVYEGNVIPLRDEDGNIHYASIIEVKDKAVTIDLNHPRAGMDLHYVGAVLEKREATNAEVSQMLNILSGDCGCCCEGGCGGGCEGGCSGGDCEGGCCNA